MSGQYLFDQYNAEYFRGRLPRYRIEFDRQMSLTEGECDDRFRVITLGGDGSFVNRKALLHEMCHISTRYHGKRFQAKLLRLAVRGEEWAREEAAAYADTDSWNEEQRTARQKLNEIAAAVRPRPSFRKVRQFLGNELRWAVGSMPWLKAAWRAACREADLPEEVKIARRRRAIARYKRVLEERSTRSAR